ncbi:IS3 family transposase, partial [Lentibacillus kimchii]
MEVAQQWIGRGYPVAKVLRIAGVARSSYYYQTRYAVKEKQVSEGRPAPGYSYNDHHVRISDEQIQEWLMELISGSGYNYGYHKLTAALRREYGLVVNKKKIYRLCQELGILRRQHRKQIHYPRRIARNRIITGSNQLWETDIKYGYVDGEDRFFFILEFLDVYDRSIIAYHMGRSCRATDAVRTLKNALWQRDLLEADTQPIIRSDNGPQYVAKAFEAACETLGCEHERIPPKTPNKNAHIESFHRVLEDDCLSRELFESYKTAYERVSEFF